MQQKRGVWKSWIAIGVYSGWFRYVAAAVVEVKN